MAGPLPTIVLVLGAAHEGSVRVHLRRRSAGWHAPPAAGEARGVAVITGPLTSVKEQASGVWAAVLASRGFAALAFDHRYFGESAGLPRQLENPWAKIADIRAAAVALHKDRRFDRKQMFAIGVCAGAGYMARAVVAMPLAEAFAYYGTSHGAVANYVNGFAVQSRAYTATFDALGAAKQIKVPTLIIRSEKALAPTLARRFQADLDDGRILWLASAGQIDFYDDAQLTAAGADSIATFFGGVGQRGGGG